jgi:hypothetical protein
LRNCWVELEAADGLSSSGPHEQRIMTHTVPSVDEGIFSEPDDFQERAAGGWFARIAQSCMNDSVLWVCDQPYRILEVEFYYHCPEHPDPFSHRAAIQKTCGQWYFHRTGNSFRGGTFKGLDLTFGSERAYSGMLIRSLRPIGGPLVEGPSLVVDHLLCRLGMATVAQLHAATAPYGAWRCGGPLSLESASRVQPCRTEACRVIATARVGLSLRRAEVGEMNWLTYAARRYRFVDASVRLRKGRPQWIHALHFAGHSVESIHALTGSPRRTIDGYVRAFQWGRSRSTAASFAGSALGPGDLCRLLGYESRHA